MALPSFIHWVGLPGLVFGIVLGDKPLLNFHVDVYMYMWKTATPYYSTALYMLGVSVLQ